MELTVKKLPGIGHRKEVWADDDVMIGHLLAMNNGAVKFRAVQILTYGELLALTDLVGKINRGEMQ